MIAPPTSILVQGQRISLDLLVARRYGDHATGMVEQVLALNPGLGAMGPYLAIGTSVLMPVIDLSAPAAPVANVVRLWS